MYLKSKIINAIILLTLCTASYANFFHWIDKNGVKNYSDRQSSKPQDQINPELYTFKSIKTDNLSREKKIKAIQGTWIQKQTNPSMEQMQILWRSVGNFEKYDEIKNIIRKNSNTILTIDDRFVTISNQLNNTTLTNNNLIAQLTKSKQAKLEFYEDAPIEIDGYWNFTSSQNPITDQFLALSSGTTSPFRSPETVRFDIEGDQLMATVKLPKELKSGTLKILYERKKTSETDTKNKKQ